MKRSIKLLYVNSGSKGKMINAYLYKSFFRMEDVEISLIHNLPYDDFYRKPSLFFRVTNKLCIPYDEYKLNKRLLACCCVNKQDIIFIVKGTNLWPGTLKKIKQMQPSVKLISWSVDDMYVKHNRTVFYTLGLKYYDLVVTTKTYNVNELKLLGARNVLFQNQAFDITEHRPCLDCSKAKYKHDVIFIGFAEKQRFEAMDYLAKQGMPVDVYGDGWYKSEYLSQSENLRLHKHHIIGNDYAFALSCSKISLCFLRNINRDLQTQRSIEITACGGFMLAERTDEHLRLFEEGKEAEFFSSHEELLQKVKYYLTHEQERRRIAVAGRERCLRDDYTYDNRAREIIDTVLKL